MTDTDEMCLDIFWFGNVLLFVQHQTCCVLFAVHMFLFSQFILLM